jgi:hypothetical protein
VREVAMNDENVPGVNLNELTALLELSLECAARAYSNGLRFDYRDLRERYSVLLLWAVLDYAHDIIALIRARRYGAISLITRSALDAYADIANLGDHHDYWEHLAVADASKWKQLHEAAGGGNPMLKDLRESELFPVARRKNAKELKALKKKGVRMLEIGERFELAGLTNEHESGYAILSSEVHNNVSHLQSRYIDSDETGSWLIAPGRTSSHSQRYEDAGTLHMSEIVILSTEKVLRLLGHGTAVMRPASSQLERIWRRVQAQDAKSSSRARRRG